MSWLSLVLMCVALSFSRAHADSKVVYAGFEHVVVVDEHLRFTVHDYHRGLRMDSSCDVMRNPPLMRNATVEDWLTAENPALDDIEFTHMGYELLMTQVRQTQQHCTANCAILDFDFLFSPPSKLQNKKLGTYVYRRCKDFQFGLAKVPCSPVASGKAIKLMAPWKLVFVGHNRAMLFNIATAEYGVYFFDADVHSGGDPVSHCCFFFVMNELQLSKIQLIVWLQFHFSQPPLLFGRLEFLQGIPNVDFAFVTLPNNAGEILLTQQKDLGRIQVCAKKFLPVVSLLDFTSQHNCLFMFHFLFAFRAI
jgi:hypothetical protein